MSTEAIDKGADRAMRPSNVAPGKNFLISADELRL
jgi:hypothetical protein